MAAQSKVFNFPLYVLRLPVIIPESAADVHPPCKNFSSTTCLIIKMQISKKGAGRVALEQWVPPTKFIDEVSKDVVNVAKGKDRGFELWRSIPLVGELYYWWFGRGREKIEAQESEEWKEAEK